MDIFYIIPNITASNITIAFVTAGIPNPAPIEINTGYIALKIWNGIK